VAVRKVSLLLGLAILFSCFTGPAGILAQQLGYPPPQRGEWHPGERGSRTDAEKQETMDRLTKMLAWRMSSTESSTEAVFLRARATELLERMKQARGNNFQFDCLASATEALLRATDGIIMARKANQIDENDKRDAALNLQKCYFRVQQADYFADLSGEKEAKQFVTYTRSLYQQARSAYDAHQYDRAQMLGDASSQIVAALENIAHASLHIPDPPVIK
jgi:ElaB/YqjD/DUF883 family membrane-anchored ribosome-binding protein